MKNFNCPMFSKNANELIDESELFLNQRGSYAGFSDYFRYKVLNTFGGLYADTDVIALRKAMSFLKRISGERALFQIQ